MTLNISSLIQHLISEFNTIFKMGKVNLNGNNNMEKIVITPGGPRLKKNVHLIESGFDAKLQDGVFVKVNKTTSNIEQELGKIDTAIFEHHISRNMLRNSAIDILRSNGGENLLPSPVTNRWIIYSGWSNTSGSPISYFSTKWIVPPPPATDNGQIIYLFNGIENSSFDLILQPVLQWGNSPAGGGSFWAITNWLVGSPASGIALHGPLVRVLPGDVLQGVIRLSRQSGGKFSYVSSFVGFPSSDLSISDIDELTWANETLECYDLKQFSDYPNTLLTAMTAIEIRLGAPQAQIIWEAHNDVIDNGQHCSIVSNASPGGAVNLFFKQQNAL